MTVKRLKLLVPVDGSANADRAVAHAIAMAKAGLAEQIHVLNVQRSLGGDVATFVGKSALKGYHHDEGMKAVASARALLDAAGVAYQVHIGVGSPGEIIAAFVRDLGCDQVVMGSRGLGGAIGMILGSVASDVIKLADVPVMVVK